ncbi:uncharacterized protein METZ01_LOCUS181230, partial [marine metagenome]
MTSFPPKESQHAQSLSAIGGNASWPYFHLVTGRSLSAPCHRDSAI